MEKGTGIVKEITRLFAAAYFVIIFGIYPFYMKNGYVENYKYEMDKIFGKDSCKDLRIRKYGGIKVL